MNAHPHNEPPRYNKIYLDKKNGKVCGVCAGIADYTGIDATIIRIVTILGLISPASGVVVIAYFLMCWLVDPKPKDLFESQKEDEFWKGVRTQPKNTIRDVRHKFREIERRLRAAEARVTSKEYRLHKEFEDLEKK
ncbi:envelope stress response membrane protein PspC [Paremcibacter congregatus]|uniref:envelope stress response membrane protein PspC n=1 Tax=Paremcibacter congregatus TaxID=2043170 RepID=UPI003A8F6693|tara:strand:- start:2301 stop:2708 length:408 start_codon:yes stop_codon:yes gene_type:complete